MCLNIFCVKIATTECSYFVATIVESLVELLQGTESSCRRTTEQPERVFDPVLKAQEACKHSQSRNALHVNIGVRCT